MLRVYCAAEVHAALPWERLAAALARAFVEGATVPLRHAHSLDDRDSLLLMPAWSEHALGVKVVTVMPGAKHTVQASYLLCDRATGAPQALLDGEALTLRRTAAASALAARHLARDDARSLLVVGCGRLAPWMVRAHVVLRPALEEVQVWGRRRDACDALVRELVGEGLAARPVSDLAEAVPRAQIVCCATTSMQPLVRGAWLVPGTHLDLVGGFRPDMREVDDEAVARARIVVDTRAGALAEAGDLLQPLERGVIGAERIAGELAQLLRGEIAGRSSPGEITLFKSVGTALEDLAAARLVVESAA